MQTTSSLLQQPPDPSIPSVATDLEGTLSAGVTWKGMYNYLLKNGHTTAAKWFYVTHMPKYLAFKIFGGNFRKFKNDWLRDLLWLFNGFSIQQFDAMCVWVVENELWPQRREAVIAELEAHLRAGRRAFVVTGMVEPLLKRLIQKLPGLEAIGTPLVWRNGLFTGELAQDLNVGESKRENLQPFTKDGKIYAAYGDTFSDVPMLEISEHPVAVYPDPKLRTEALARGWRILDEG